MGIFKRDKTVQGTSGNAQVPVTKVVTRVTYEDRNGIVQQHDVVLPEKDSNRFNVHHVIADRVDGAARIIDMSDIGKEH